MKLTAVLVAVILFTGGVSCNTKDKNETITTVDNVLPEIPVKEEKAAPVVQTVDTLTKTAKSKPVKARYGKFVRKEEVSVCSEPPPPLEKEIKTAWDSSEIFTKVEIEAEYPGGPAAWQRFLNRNLRLPEEAFENEVMGTAVVQFVVDRDGNVSNIEAVSGPELLCSALIQVIQKSGKWMPAVQGGRQVKSLKKQPICIRLETEG